jgi:plasmid stability protein
MVTKIEGIPDQLMVKVEETAAQEGISVPELVREALEQRINGKGFAAAYAIARRRGQQTGVTPENVESVVEAEIAALRAERR